MLIVDPEFAKLLTTTITIEISCGGPSSYIIHAWDEEPNTSTLQYQEKITPYLVRTGIV
jgi:hypothetical protein